MRWYAEVRAAVKQCVPSLLPTQGANLALLVRAILLKRSLGLTDLARTFPRPAERQVPHPKHDVLHRVKRLWRFLNNERVDPLQVQLAFVPYTLASLKFPRWVGLVVDWTYFDAPEFRVQVLRIGLARRGRVIPVLQVAYDRDDLPADKSQNQIEEEALAAVLKALPARCTPIILADRGFARAEFFRWLLRRDLQFVIRIDRGTCITDADGTRTKLGTEGLTIGARRWFGRVRYALYHGRPNDLWVNVAAVWLTPKERPHRHPTDPDEPWYLATTLPKLELAVAWYRMRFWIEESFKDSKGRFLLDEVRVSTPDRLNTLLMALTIALCWLSLIAQPQLRILPPGWNAAVVTWGRASFLHQALVFLDDCWILPQVWEAT